MTHLTYNCDICGKTEVSPYPRTRESFWPVGWQRDFTKGKETLYCPDCTEKYTQFTIALDALCKTLQEAWNNHPTPELTAWVNATIDNFRQPCTRRDQVEVEEEEPNFAVGDGG